MLFLQRRRCESGMAAIAARGSGWAPARRRDRMPVERVAGTRRFKERKADRDNADKTTIYGL
jgi:hypothetical protein